MEEYINELRNTLKEIRELAECNKYKQEQVFFRKIVEKVNEVI